MVRKIDRRLAKLLIMAFPYLSIFVLFYGKQRSSSNLKVINKGPRARLPFGSHEVLVNSREMTGRIQMLSLWLDEEV